MDSIARDSLSAQQRECLRLVWDQRSSKEIALQLGISKNTVDGYITEAVTRLGARDRRDAARRCYGESSPDGPPDRIGGDAARVALTAPCVTPILDGALDRASPWRRWLPFRTGAHNDLNLVARSFWIIGVAAIVSVGFGAFASGVHVISDLFR